MGLWLLAWLGVPALVALLCLGLGLLVQAALRLRLALVELAGVGLAALIVLTTLLTEFPATAHLASALTLVAALVGWALGGVGLLERHHRGWPLLSAAGVYALYAAPAALAGVTFTGFISLDDTADWMAFADRLVTAGHTTEGLAHSTFGRLLDVNWAAGYPVGAFAQLGVVAQLLHIDAAWVVQPLMATIAAVLAAALYALTARVVAGRALRAVIALVAASSALLYGYVLWGGLKEVTMAALLAVGAMCVARRDPAPAWAHAALLAVPLAAVYVVFGLAGMVYIAPLAVVQLVVTWRRWGARASGLAAAAFVVVAAVLAVPALRMLGTQLAALRTASLTGAADIGNLYAPLKFWQVAGIWPSGDFREAPAIPLLTWLLIAVAVVCAVLGLVMAWRARAVALLAYAGTAMLVAGYSVFGNAWLEGKALAISSPAVLLAAGVGMAWLVEHGRRFEGYALGAMVALGVGASVLMGYRDAWVAPPARMHELAQIGASDLPAPALMLEYSPIAGRWFLRDLDAEVAGELRWNLIPLRTGAGLGKGAYADIDDYPAASLAPYPTLVLRNDVNGSRPPSNYRLERQGDAYDVWVADPTAPRVLGHWPLGDHADPAAVAPCSVVQEAAAAAGAGGRLAFVRRAPVLTVDVTADGAAPVTVPAAGEYRGTLMGSVFGPVTVSVDGTEWATISTSLNWTGFGTALPPIPLDAGEHVVTVESRTGWGPGQGRRSDSVGPLLMSTQGPDAPVEYVPVAQAQSLCGQRLDWIEAVAG